MSSRMNGRIPLFTFGLMVFLLKSGGGFCAGSSYTGLLAHLKILNHFKRFSDKKLVIFSFEYPLAPEHRYPAQMDAAVAAYKWLVQHVGCSEIVLGGDSAGGNIALLLYSRLLGLNRETGIVLPKSIVLISPWLDVSLSHTPPHIQHEMATTGDYVGPHILQQWRDNITPSGIHPRDPRISPFFDLNPLPMPPCGMLLVYGSNESFGPVIDDWVKSVRKQQPNASQLKVILGVDMPHDFPIILNSLPGAGYQKANRALLEIARFLGQCI
ncbi:Alpha/Beta hydrolase protein [Gorgonomyces haynaldii]|nr:Alpha/Beta hydrolase protein [Gorgonomyces haynaldii]